MRPHHTRLLETETRLRIGRTAPSDFIVNVKSVSSRHLDVIVHADGSGQMRIFGKISTYKGEQIRVEDPKKPIVIDFKGSTKITIGVSKTTEQVITFVYKRVVVWLARDVSVDEEKLATMGVLVTRDYTKATTQLVVNKKSPVTSQMEALIEQVPIVTVQFLNELVQRRDRLIEDFTKNYPTPSDYLVDEECRPNPLRSDIFKGLTFIFSEENQYRRLSPILEKAHAICHLFTLTESTTPQDYSSFVSSHSTDKDDSNHKTTTVLVQPQATNLELFKSRTESSTPMEEERHIKILDEGAKLLGRYLITSENIFTAVATVNSSGLTRERSVRKGSPGSMGDGGPPVKKQRRGHKIKPLDSLDFFAGGGKSEETQTKLSQVIPPSDLAEHESELPVDDKKKKKKRSRIAPLENQMLDVNFTPSLDKKDTSQQIPPSVPETTSTRSPSSSSLTVQEVNKTDPGTHSNSETSNNTPLESSSGKRIHEDSETQSFSTAIVQAKKKADERIKEQMGTTLPLESDLAVEHLRDLAIVETTPMPLRTPPTRSQSDTGHGEDWRPEWSQRKNFKVFVKNSTKGRPAQSFTCLKEYVSFEVYDPAMAKLTKRDEEMLDAVDRAKVADPVYNGNSGATRHPTVADKGKHVSLFVASDEDDDGDEDMPMYSFADTGHARDDGLDMNLRMTEPQRIPEFKRNLSLEPAEISRNKESVMTAGIKSRPTARSGARTAFGGVESDGDSDDEPHFNFR
ncbi:CYFA0S08e00738g1_1 [Cyberlindnera fabianii]|uniref:CYFA0S08e00738g1_1 n=1 Tax=Cyberlindnera fabianii TaxID=36022 RepID=A0A061AX95_CYBFA|nr:CYFA0S08e00738g1_1 [Cyberlindnera fabianii]